MIITNYALWDLQKSTKREKLRHSQPEREHYANIGFESSMRAEILLFILSGKNDDGGARHSPFAPFQQNASVAPAVFLEALRIESVFREEHHLFGRHCEKDMRHTWECSKR